MRIKAINSTSLAIVLALLFVTVVIAGSTRDRGTLETDPPDGTVNWTAWLWKTTGFPAVYIYPPEEIMTEDSFNYAQDTDLGYTDDGWQIQVENFTNSSFGDYVGMAFCGLNDQIQKNWQYTFQWDQTTEEHGEVPLFTSSGYVAPALTSVDIVDETKVVTFYGDPNTTYQIYRSTSPAPSGDRSNGRYKLQGTATTDSTGLGQFIDDTPEITTVPSWYEIIYFGEGEGTYIIGCHSEEADPTGVRVFDFDAVYNPDTQAVDLSWKKSDPSIIGFNVFRGTNENVGNAVQINTDQINAMDEEPFTYEDSDIVMGETYYYWIELIDTEGPDDKVGPRTVVPGFRIFLPIVRD